MPQGQLGKDNSMEKKRVKKKKNTPSTKHYTENQTFSNHEPHQIGCEPMCL
jgi:hypothetical protein